MNTIYLDAYDDNEIITSDYYNSYPSPDRKEYMIRYEIVARRRYNSIRGNFKKGDLYLKDETEFTESVDDAIRLANDCLGNPLCQSVDVMLCERKNGRNHYIT